MKIVICVEGFPPKTGGGAFTNWKFAEYAQGQGHDVHVFTNRIEESQKIEDRKGVTIHRPFKGMSEGSDPHHIRSILQRIIFAILLTYYLLRWIRGKDVDTLLSTSHLLHPPAKITGTIYRIPVLNFIAYSPVLHRSNVSATNLFYLFEQFNFRFMMGEIVYSRTKIVRDQIEKVSYTSTNVHMIHGVLDPLEFKNLKEESCPSIIETKISQKNCPIYVHVGRMDKIKRTPELVTLFSSLSSNGVLFIIGDGPLLKEVKDRVHEENLQDRVHILGRKPHSEVLKLLKCADTLLLTSEAEAYPTVAFEGLATSCNVLSTPVGGLSDMSHERLHIAELKDIPDKINSDSLVGSCEVDEEVVERYSRKRFNQEILGGMFNLIYHK